MRHMAARPILMPKLGLTMTEGLLAEWHVAAGDEVRAGDIIFAVETDKITSEVEARGDGRIEEIAVQAGETVPVGAVVALWTGPAMEEEQEESAPPSDMAQSDRDKPGGDQSGESNLAASPHEDSRKSALNADLDAHGGSADKRNAWPDPNQLSEAGGRIIATPYARALARKAGLTLELVSGSGPRGRIKAVDVERALAQPSSVFAESAASAPIIGGASIALAELDLTAIKQFEDEFAQAGETVTTSMFLERAARQTGMQIAVSVSASGCAWQLPSLAEGGVAMLTLGPVRPQYRPDADGAPTLRQIAPIALVTEPASDPAALLDNIVQALERPLRLLL